MPAALELRNLTKRYGNVVGVHDLSLDLAPGEVLGFLGPNGAGKTTTIRCVLDTIRPTEGQAVGRRRLVGEKLLGLVGLVAVFSAVTWLSSWTSGRAVDLGVSAGRMLAATVAAGLLGLLFGALALLAGRRPGAAGPRSACRPRSRSAPTS